MGRDTSSRRTGLCPASIFAVSLTPIAFAGEHQAVRVHHLRPPTVVAGRPGSESAQAQGAVHGSVQKRRPEWGKVSPRRRSFSLNEVISNFPSCYRVRQQPVHLSVSLYFQACHHLTVQVDCLLSILPTVVGRQDCQAVL